MKKTNFLATAVILLLVLNAATLFIVFHMHLYPGRSLHGNRNDKGPSDYIIRQLQLDEQQQKKFAELRNTHHEFVRNAHAEEERLHDLYFSLLKSDNPDQSKVDSVASLIGNQQKEIAAAAFDHFRQLRAICREDQKKLYDNTIDDIARMVVGHPDGPPPGR